MMQVSKKFDSKIAIVSVLVLGIFVFSAFAFVAIPSTAALSPVLRLVPAKGHAGRSVKATGLNFTPGATAVISVEGTGGSTVASVVVNSTGGFTTTFKLPALPCLSAGCVRVIEANDGHVSATHDFTVVQEIIPSAHVVKPGDVVSINGTGFAQNSPLTVTFAGSIVSISPTSNSQGNCSFTLTVPSTASKGANVVTVQDNLDNTASLTLHVDS